MMELEEIRGLGPSRLAKLRAMGIDSLRDLLLYFPVRYENMSTEAQIEDSVAAPALLRVTLKGTLNVLRFRGITKVQGKLLQGSAQVNVVWYNQPWMKQQLLPGKEYLLYGQSVMKQNALWLQNPKIVSEKGIYPVYRSIEGLPQKTLRSMLCECLDQTDDLFPETLPDIVLQTYRLMAKAEAVRTVHLPPNMERLHDAQRRLFFEEMLIYQAAMGMKSGFHSGSFPMKITGEMEETYWNALGFSPTEAQRRVLREIAGDMKREVAMSRLVQGDVGCGKTALAFGSIYLCFRSGFQSAMMAPTEILAIQHYQEACRALGPLGVVCRLLTGSTKEKERRDILSDLESGHCHAVFGTHALISDRVKYHELGLVVTDEQHRFGVRQRSMLQSKGRNQEGAMPHVLVMSATPIPRSLALILYGDLDVSIVDELPPGRTPVKTRIVPESKRNGMYTFLRDEVSRGRQGYVVCPLVEDSEAMEDIRSAQSTYEELVKNELKGLRVGLTWGNQNAVEKNQVLQAFAGGSIDILISTTVIEVGVNVPNASVMIVENASRFGLSQLHQLRGRVGRGNTESWCFLVADANEKLSILARTNDGFQVAQKDLEIRGPGDIMGTRQSGQPLQEMLMRGGIQLLDEAVRCMKMLREQPELEEARKQVERLAVGEYRSQIQEIALN